MQQGGQRSSKTEYSKEKQTSFLSARCTARSTRGTTAAAAAVSLLLSALLLPSKAATSQLRWRRSAPAAATAPSPALYGQALSSWHAVPHALLSAAQWASGATQHGAHCSGGNATWHVSTSAESEHPGNSNNNKEGSRVVRQAETSRKEGSTAEEGVAAATEGVAVATARAAVEVAVAVGYGAQWCSDYA